MSSQDTKRENYLIWKDYFMALAFLARERSKDPNYQVGACIIHTDKSIVSIGYNGFPLGCEDDDFPWGRNPSSPLDNKHTYVCHAEMNAIMFASAVNLKGCAMYVTLFPCDECAKVIIQAGIKEVHYFSDETGHRPEFIASRNLLEDAGIELEYNGMPIGCSDDEFPWAKKTPSPLDSKFLYVCHAEMNAILNKNSVDVKDCSMYVGLFPCNECAKMIIQSGITKIYYFSDEKGDRPMYIASKRMFDAAGVKYEQYIPKRSKIEINFKVDWDSMSPSK